MQKITAGRLQIIKARLFGKRVRTIEPPTKTDKGCIIKAYWYKSVMYVNEVQCQA